MDRMYNKFRRSRSPIRRDDRDEFRSRKRDNYRSPSPVTRRSNHSSSHRSRSRSPRDRKGHGGNRVNPCPSRVLGVFGLSVHTTEAQLRQIFSKFGPIDRLKLVYDTKTGRSRGFCFVYYDNKEDARAAKDQCSGMEIDHQRIRVDFSLTARAHSPTPGVYMGKPTREFAERDRDYHHHQSHQPSSNSHRTSSSTAPNHRRPSRRSPSPQYRRRRNRSASYSPRMR